MHSKNLAVLCAPHSQQIAILDISTHLACCANTVPIRGSGWSSYPRRWASRFVIVIALLSGLWGLHVVGLDWQSVIALRVVDGTIMVAHGIEFASFLGALNQADQQTPVAGQEVVVR
jgi:hypothetical protein